MMRYRNFGVISALYRKGIHSSISSTRVFPIALTENARSKGAANHRDRDRDRLVCAATWTAVTQTPTCANVTFSLRGFSSFRQFSSLRDEEDDVRVDGGATATATAHELSSIFSTIDPKSVLADHDKQMMLEMAAYRVKYGHCNTPTRGTASRKREREEEGVSDDLANWIMAQRQHMSTVILKTKKRKRKSTSFQIIAGFLDSLGFIWSAHDASWARNFHRFQKYMDDQRKSSKRTVITDKHIDRWVKEQRRNFMIGNLKSERIEALASIEGFSFNPLQMSWQENYERLVKFKQEHGTCLVPENYKEDPQLAFWVMKQRARYKRGVLLPERKDALDALGFIYQVNNTSWNASYERLREFYERHGHMNLPQSEEFLHSWMYRQRRRFQVFERETDGDKMDEESQRHYELLREISFSFNPHDDSWDDYFQRLCQYKETYGTTYVPYSYSGDRDLVRWVRAQRSAYNANKLSEDRVARLKGIGFEWSALDHRWRLFFDQVVHYRDVKGQIRIPQNERTLRAWATRQRKILGHYVHNRPDPSAPANEKEAQFLALDKMGFRW